MRQIVRLSVIGMIIVSATGCATLVGGGSNQPVSINSEPAGASFAIKSSSGIQMASGQTPQSVVLPRKNEYQIEFTVPGYRTQSVPLTKGVNGWVWGNFLIGWLPGLIIDFATGSANKLEPAVVQVALARGTAGLDEAKLFGVVRQLDENGRVVSEQRVEMIPAK